MIEDVIIALGAYVLIFIGYMFTDSHNTDNTNTYMRGGAR